MSIKGFGIKVVGGSNLDVTVSTLFPSQVDDKVIAKQNIVAVKTDEVPIYFSEAVVIEKLKSFKIVFSGKGTIQGIARLNDSEFENYPIRQNNKFVCEVRLKPIHYLPKGFGSEIKRVIRYLIM